MSRGDQVKQGGNMTLTHEAAQAISADKVDTFPPHRHNIVVLSVAKFASTMRI